MEVDAIVFAFESGEPNPQNPGEAPQYLGEFRVAEVNEGGVVLQPILSLDRYSGERLTRSRGEWSLYETMPIDRHELFARFSDEELSNILPGASAEEYIRQGTPATEDDDEWHRKGYNEEGEVVGPENPEQVVKWLYDRPLRAYDYLFGELARELVVKRASIEAVTEDNTKLEAALKSAEELGVFREEDIEARSKDLAGMKRDREAIEEHLNQVQQLLSNAQELIDDYRSKNLSMAVLLKKRQLQLLQMIDSIAPAPSPPVLLGP